MDGAAAGFLGSRRSVPGVSFGAVPSPSRRLDSGMGLAVGRRTIFRPEDSERFSRVADRVAEGNMALLGRPPTETDQAERIWLRNAIATGALITAGRHLQHGDAAQPGRNMELFTNCATAIASFAKFYLLLNGCGVGRSYDDELIAVDWAEAPDLRLHLDRMHPDFPRDRIDLVRLAIEFGRLAPATTTEQLSVTQEEELHEWIASRLSADAEDVPESVVRHVIDDSREGWAKAVELLESMAFERRHSDILLLDFSAIRPRGTPIRGMQGRPASGPLSLAHAFINIAEQVIAPARESRSNQRYLAALGAGVAGGPLSLDGSPGGRRAARRADGDEILAQSRHLPLHPRQE